MWVLKRQVARLRGWCRQTPACTWVERSVAWMLELADNVAASIGRMCANTAECCRSLSRAIAVALRAAVGFTCCCVGNAPSSELRGSTRWIGAARDALLALALSLDRASRRSRTHSIGQRAAASGDAGGSSGGSSSVQFQRLLRAEEGDSAVRRSGESSPWFGADPEPGESSRTRMPGLELSVRGRSREQIGAGSETTAGSAGSPTALSRMRGVERDDAPVGPSPVPGSRAGGRAGAD